MTVKWELPSNRMARTWGPGQWGDATACGYMPKSQNICTSSLFHPFPKWAVQPACTAIAWLEPCQIWRIFSTQKDVQSLSRRGHDRCTQPDLLSM